MHWNLRPFEIGLEFSVALTLLPKTPLFRLIQQTIIFFLYLELFPGNLFPCFCYFWLLLASDSHLWMMCDSDSDDLGWSQRIFDYLVLEKVEKCSWAGFGQTFHVGISDTTKTFWSRGQNCTTPLSLIITYDHLRSSKMFMSFPSHLLWRHYWKTF